MDGPCGDWRGRSLRGRKGVELAGKARLGLARRCKAGADGREKARHGAVRLSKARQCRQGGTRSGMEWSGGEMQGASKQAWQGAARPRAAWHSNAGKANK